MKTLWVVALFILTNQSHANNSSLILGVIPYVSTSKIIIHNNIVRKHLNNSTKYDVTLVSAKSLKTYIDNLKEYKYDIILSAPHLARFVEKKYGYQRVAMSTHTIRGVYVTKKTSSISSIADLKGKVVSLISPKSLIHQMTIKQISENDIDPHIDIRIKPVKTFNNAIYDVLNGYSHATVTGIKIWQELPVKVKKNLKKIAQTDPTSGFIILAKPSLNKQTINTIQSSLLEFNDMDYAKSYIFQGFRLIKDNDMKSLDFHSKIFE